MGLELDRGDGVIMSPASLPIGPQWYFGALGLPKILLDSAHVNVSTAQPRILGIESVLCG